MKDKLFIIILSFFCVFGYCQEEIYRVDYQFRQYGKDKLATLHFNSISSIFIYDNTGEKSKLEEVSASEYKIDSKNTDVEGRKYFVSIKDSLLISREFFFNEPYIIEENIPSIEWELMNVKKKIGDYECLKAVGSFRGRLYTAWYSPEVPVSYGPWKLGGLPGLIFECNDDKNDLHFLIKKIQKIDNKKNIIIPPKNGVETLTIEQYKEKLENGEKELEERLRSKIPRGVTVKLAKVRYNPMELEFEN